MMGGWNAPDVSSHVFISHNKEQESGTPENQENNRQTLCNVFAGLQSNIYISNH